MSLDSLERQIIAIKLIILVAGASVLGCVWAGLQHDAVVQDGATIPGDAASTVPGAVPGAGSGVRIPSVDTQGQ